MNPDVLMVGPRVNTVLRRKKFIKNNKRADKKKEKERKYQKPGKIKWRNVTKSQSKINVSKRIQINNAVIRKLFGSIFMSILSKNYNLRYFFVGNCGRKSRCLKGGGNIRFRPKYWPLIELEKRLCVLVSTLVFCCTNKSFRNPLCE